MISKCDNCSRVQEEKYLVNQFPNISGLLERLEPGGEVPAGECLTCGALTYLVPAPLPAVYKSASFPLNAMQVGYLDGAVNATASGSDCVYVNLEILTDHNNDFSEMPGGEETLQNVIKFCQENNVIEVQFYC